MTDLPPSVGPSMMRAPDWEQFTDEDLLGHALASVDDLYQLLLAHDADPNRPEGAIAISTIDIPCHDPDDCTLQLRYIGHMTEKLTEYKVMVRDFVAMEEGPTGVPAIRLVVCTQEGVEMAKQEAAPRH